MIDTDSKDFDPRKKGIDPNTEGIDSDKEDIDSPSQESETKKTEIHAALHESKNDLQHFLRSLQEDFSRQIQSGKDVFDKTLQSLDKWLSSNKDVIQEKTHSDLDALHRTIQSSSLNPLDRSPAVRARIQESAENIRTLIVLGKDANPIANAFLSLMRFVLNTEK